MDEPELTIIYRSKEQCGLRESLFPDNIDYSISNKVDNYNREDWIKFTENYYSNCLSVPVNIANVDLHFNMEFPIAEKIKMRYENASVLELGCGTGVFASLLAKRGYAKNVIAIEQCPNLVLNARRTIREFGVEDQVEIMESSIETLRDMGKFDVVLAMSVLEHVYNVEEVLSKVVSFMKPKGTFWGLVPFIRNCDCITHLHYFDSLTLLKLLSKYFTEVIISKVDISRSNNYLLILECKYE